MSMTSVLSQVPIIRAWGQGKESSTLSRLIRSRHVADLRVIFWLFAIVTVAGIFAALVFCFEYEVIQHWPTIRQGNTGWAWLRIVLSALGDLFASIGTVVAVGGAVIAWIYKAGSARLGVVDLFACEIATLCRVITVSETVQHYISLANSPPEKAARFSSQESYFPVFDSTIRDLQQLEQEVVQNVTAFYTYLKVTRDHMRRLSEIEPSTADAATRWHTAIVNVMYMLFLSLESARHSIQDLVEFQPTQADDTITILLSEIDAYDWLCQHVKDDLRLRRLAAREATYRAIIPKLRARVINAKGEEWERPKDTVTELMKRFQRIFPDQPSTNAALHPPSD